MTPQPQALVPVRRALISVSDKEGLAELAQGLHQAGVELYSTGGTRAFLETQGLPVHDVAAYTGFPEMMDGRVKTLHPRIFAGILARHDRADDQEALATHDIRTFELVVVNLYPFAATIAKPGCTHEEAVEKVDIGGPSLVRAAAKNHAFTAILTAPSQYANVLSEIQNQGGTTLTTRKHLMAAAFEHTATYDRAIANYFASLADPSQSNAPDQVTLQLQRFGGLRYGENPHQSASLYRWVGAPSPSLVDAKQLNGKELSYNNYLDLDAAWRIAKSLPAAAASVIKHNNPCGAASGATLVQACEKAMLGDPVSAFGSILGFNQEVDGATAEYLSTPGLFVEAIVAPKFSPEALQILTTRPKWKANVRLVELPQNLESKLSWEYRQIDGGFLAQESDTLPEDESLWRTVTQTQADPALLAELRFAWAICRHVKSNAITVCRDQALCGAGAGQMSRVDSVDIAIRKSGERVKGAVLASDAFFPFPDSIHIAAKAGIVAFIQPGGSKNDQEVIDACNEHHLPMIFTAIRHFRH